MRENYEAVLERKKWEIVKSLEELQRKLLSEMGGVDKATLTHLRKILDNFDNLVDGDALREAISKYAVVLSRVQRITTQLDALESANDDLAENINAIADDLSELRDKSGGDIESLADQLSDLVEALTAIRIPSKLSELENDVFARPDLAVNDETDPAYVKGRTHYVEPAKETPNAISWDGNTSGLVETTITTGRGATLYKVAEIPDGWDETAVRNLDLGKIKINGLVLSGTEFDTPNENEISNGCYGWRCFDIDTSATVTIVWTAGAQAWTAQLTPNGYVKFPETGIYFTTHISSFEYTTITPEVVHTIEPKFLPCVTIDEKITINGDGGESVSYTTSYSTEELFNYWCKGGFVRINSYIIVDNAPTLLGSWLVTAIGCDPSQPENGLLIESGFYCWIMFPDGTIRRQE